MGTTKRHLDILDIITSNFLNNNRKNKNIEYGREQIALVKNHEKLIDIASLTDEQKDKLELYMNTMKIIQPDFFVFKNNPYLTNNKVTRYVGVPDLIIEVWSETNKEEDKSKLRELYISSGSVFWEIDQDNPLITCWENGRMSQHSLRDPIKTPWGQVLDLTDLYHDVKDIEIPDVIHGGYDTGEDIDL